MFFEIFPIVGQTRHLLRLHILKGIGQSHVAVALVMPVGLTISGDMNQLGPRTALGEPADQSPGKDLSIGEEVLKGHRPGNRPIIKKQVDFPTRGKP